MKYIRDTYRNANGNWRAMIYQIDGAVQTMSLIYRDFDHPIQAANHADELIERLKAGESPESIPEFRCCDELVDNLPPKTEFRILPTFEPWENYDSEQLAAIVRGWKLILDHPAFQCLLNHAYQTGWQQWQNYGQKCIAEIQAELEKRK